ncbi:MAG TPA: excinuclease ABC subunit UvrA [Bacteroidales bacterium]|nr:excinuclease ABC subunit UvrA [Bacteroidales bacterium]HOK74721.1 excinuclease ABC subunit UvrA [Bacteroidales bacterium]HOM40425.1 excinuclease ABC subunit UvrA [Bacteroidales bacterium]HOU29830.1 excinuclease ABC subunit UvrA [Bacteroidales bacterium]HPP93145.1 excinuclease ABC subunit UvrA [Bacteroidales bacterium]
MSDRLTVLGARVHNLKNIDVTIPRNKLVVITGLSGSGKSSLAFDTIYAEGQRRYMETLSAYARQFLGGLERPDVDKITGLSPVISIEQKSTSKNPRSTVGTITEIYDYLRLLYARAADAYSYASGEKMVRYNDEQIIELIEKGFHGKKINILAPVVRGRKGHYRELFERLRLKGYLYARINGEIREITPGMKLDRYKTHFIEIVIDKFRVGEVSHKRLRESVLLALDQGDGVMMILDRESDKIRYFSRHLMCPVTGISYNEPAPHTFSFNSPQGACPHCNGLGEISDIDINKIIPDRSLSIRKGGIEPLGKYRNTWIFWQIEAILEKSGYTIDTPISELPEDVVNKILFGSDEVLILSNTPLGLTSNYFLTFEGVISFLGNLEVINGQRNGSRLKDQYVEYRTCPECNGNRLKKEALWFRIADKNIGELAAMDIRELYSFLASVEEKMSEKQKKIASEILKEIRARLSFLLEVGLDYLSLNRSARTLSGGESQRIRLATQIGSKLVNVLYILDEPSIGLHQRDNRRLISSLRKLRDEGNSVIVVEHDRDMIMSADHIIDVGPGAGVHGGRIVAQGPPQEFMHCETLTAAYLSNCKRIEVPDERRRGNGKYLIIRGASGNNLKNIDVAFPLGMFICVTGVSGSGKSSLINHTLHPALARKYHNSGKTPLPYHDIIGTEHIDKVIEVDQAPIGKTPRSNPATYTGVFTDIRSLFAQTAEAKIRGFGPGRFSFNVKGGRCEGCEGAGVKTIEMNFLPDVYVLCTECNGKRYNRETLEVKYKGKSISDVLEMTVDEAVEFFSNVPAIYHKIKTLQDVGLGYIKIGQQSTTLSGGESQRVKLATELARRDTGKTLYILDEPTTGLHFEDVRVLLNVLNRLVDRGNTVIVIEHNMEVIKMADYIIDLGPEGGKEGGYVVFSGPPEEIIKCEKSYTGAFLKRELEKTVHK